MHLPRFSARYRTIPKSTTPVRASLNWLVSTTTPSPDATRIRISGMIATSILAAVRVNCQCHGTVCFTFTKAANSEAIINLQARTPGKSPEQMNSETKASFKLILVGGDKHTYKINDKDYTHRATAHMGLIHISSSRLAFGRQ